ncbi:unnamed protein product [Urochloa humidicola]
MAEITPAECSIEDDEEMIMSLWEFVKDRGADDVTQGLAADLVALRSRVAALLQQQLQLQDTAALLSPPPRSPGTGSTASCSPPAARQRRWRRKQRTSSVLELIKDQRLSPTLAAHELPEHEYYLLASHSSLSVDGRCKLEDDHTHIHNREDFSRHCTPAPTLALVFTSRTVNTN